MLSINLSFLELFAVLTFASSSKAPYVNELRFKILSNQFRLAGAQAELDETMAVLKEKQDKLASVEAKVCGVVF